MPNLNPTSQERELLLLLENSGRAVDEQQLDGRVLRALLTRNWARRCPKGIEITEVGRKALTEDPPTQGRRRRQTKRNPRGQAVMRAVERLEKAVPADSELAVGPMFAHIDDLLTGFRKLAKRMDRPSA